MRYHLVGSQGISMSGLAKLLEARGHAVSGSDLALGGHRRENITSDIDYVIISSAVTPQSAGWVEVEEANRRKIPVLKRSVMIGELMRGHNGIAVSGTHGKTTTTAMIGLMLEAAGLDPTILIGGVLPPIGGNVRVGQSEYFVAEACEYDRSFLDFEAKIGIVTNIEAEHLDYYTGGLPEIIDAFSQFMAKLPPQGALIVWGDDPNIEQAILARPLNVKTVIRCTNESALPIKLQVPGWHNVRNALMALAVADFLKIDRVNALRALENFQGVKRRFERKGEKAGVLVYDDYAHHPTEIKAVIQGARAVFPERRLVLVFGPHQYSRTRLLFDQFVRVFEEGHAPVVVADIYETKGRDEAPSIHSKDLVEALLSKGVEAYYGGDPSGILEQLRVLLKPGDLLLTVGASDINKVGEAYLK